MDQDKPILENLVSIYEKPPSNSTPTPSKKGEGRKEEVIYRPPHLNPVFYGDNSAPQKKISRERRRAMKRLLEDPDIMEEEDLPTEIYYGAAHTTAKYLEKMREREKYEEENFTRLPQTKRDKLIQKQLERGEVPFGRIRKDYIKKVLESSDDEEELAFIKMTSGKKKKFRKFKHKKDRKKFKKRR
ncbi:unnamed protein product [Hymenolepis diminuta]|uniref:Uncharacterized protein n=1 Tax=Hymenolepis diminuta TaxID=6216 RepID=A0A564XYG8_HYMDI|nr:unnamed protein product [Hymenolepis diminuta]